MNLMSKLAMNSLWAPDVQKQANHQSIIIFDWDDTLMASTCIGQFKNLDMHRDNCRDQLPKFVLNYLADLEKQVVRLLKKSIRNGLTFIITNAGLGWVELTAMRFMPTVHREFIRNADKYGIKIISAREMFEQ